MKNMSAKKEKEPLLGLEIFVYHNNYSILVALLLVTKVLVIT